MPFNRKTVQVITAPAASPISLADMKIYLRVDTTDDDALIQDFIDAATTTVKQYIRRSLISETLEFTMDGFGINETYADERLVRLGAGVHTISYPYVLGRTNEVDIPFPPIQSITSVKTFDRSNNESTFDSSNYELDEQGGRVYLNEGETWPSDLRAREGVKIRYVSGYGDAATDIPDPIIQAIRLYVGKMYDCREAYEMPEQCKAILSPYALKDALEWY